MLMGSKSSCCSILVMIYVSLSPFVGCMHSYNPDYLDAFVHDHALKSIVKPHTGILYNITLPANFSGIQVSAIRLRAATFWARGAKLNSFSIPPRVIPKPSVKRLDIVSQNLGNWSSFYYKVPNHTLVTHVVGFLTYDATNSRRRQNAMLNLSVLGEPIVVKFPRIAEAKGEKGTRKCVRFGTDGSVELSNMTRGNACAVQGQGHFSVVIPSHSKKEARLWKWWVIGIGVGIFGVAVVGLVGVLIHKLVRMKRIRKMERQSEKSEALEITWIGRSKMPAAAGIRTQPVLENECAP